MTYLRRSNVSEKRSRSITFAITGLLIILFTVHFFFPRFYPTVFYPVASIFWKGEHSIGGWIYNMSSIVRSKYSIVEENKRLDREIRSRDSSMLMLGALKKENEDLKSILGRKPEGRIVLGVVLSRPPVSPYDSLIIDIGTKEGVSVGDKVYAEGSVLIGDVAEVYARQSKVSLFSTPGRQSSALFVDSNIQTEVIGKGSGNFIATIPVEAGVETGDLVLFPEVDSHIFGIVEKVLVDSADSFATVLFKAPVNIHGIRFVEIRAKN